MKIIALKNNLKDGVDAVSKVISDSSSSLPILKNILFDVDDGKIKACATNLEIAITAYIPGKIIENGGLTLPSQVFQSVLNNLQTERINLESNNERIIIETDNYDAKIQGIKKDEFPIIPKIKEGAGKIIIQADLFIDSISAVMNSAQISENRPELSGVLFDYTGDYLKMASTDSFRLSERRIDNKQIKASINPFKAVVPLKTISEAARIFKREGSLEIYLDDNQILIKNDYIEIISRLLSVNFPEYEAIIPKNIETEAIFSKNELIHALKLVSAFTDKFNEIKAEIKDKEIEITSYNQGVGENKYLIPAKIKGKGLKMVLNWKFLLDGVKGIMSENVVMGITNEDKPIILKPDSGENYFYVLMPIKSN